MSGVGDSHRPVAHGHHGLVASAHALATLAGVDVLRAGGNAVDAAVAVNGVLAVVQPHMCGLGGDFFCMLYDAPSDAMVCLDGAGRSGSRASVEALRGRGLTAVPLVGPLAVSVPGCVGAWGALLARYGTRPLGDLLKPAIALAADGFPASARLADSIEERRKVITDPEWQRIYAPAGAVPTPGGRLRQPDLARSLELIAAGGPEAFYHGELAARLVRHVEAGGGFLTAEDLASHAARWQPPVGTAYRDATVWTTPPPSQGVTLLLALSLVEGFGLPGLDLDEAARVHLLVEAIKVAYADRNRFVGDPDHVSVPVAALLDKGYVAQRRALIDPERAALDVAPGDPGGDTTGFVVADPGGSVVAVVQSLYSAFGAGVLPPGTGIVLQNRGAGFSLDPASPTALAPRKQPFHTLMATLVARAGRPVVAVATMGGHAQPQIHLQVLTGLLDAGRDPQAAIEHPRFVQGRMRPTDPEGRLRIERRVPARVLAGLGERGHHLDVVAPWTSTMGHAQALVVDEGPDGRLLAGGADPRGDGVALGY